MKFIVCLLLLFSGLEVNAQRKFVVRNGDTIRYTLPHTQTVNGAYTERKTDTPKFRGVAGHGIKSIARVKKKK